MQAAPPRRSLSIFLFGLAAVSAGGICRGVDPTEGGKGGQTILVTTLEDSGPGSLREAAEAKADGPRLILFSVGGEIWLKSALSVRGAFVTIDGTSAPAPGITLMGDSLRLRGHDIIVRDIRVRVGAREEGTRPDIRDGIAITGSEDGSRPAYNILVENCSVSWSIDENMEVWGKNNHSVTIRNCLIAEALKKSLHPKGNHAMGLLVGPEVRDVVIEGNLFAGNAHRNPVVHGSASAIVVNNLIYNPEHSAFHIYRHETGQPTLASVVGNVVIAGPNTKPVLRMFGQGANAGSQIYLSDNLAAGTKTFDTSELAGKEAKDPSPLVQTPPVPLDGLSILPASQVEEHVLKSAGARPGERDDVDARIVAEVRARTGSIKNWPADVRLNPKIKPDDPSIQAANRAPPGEPLSKGP